MGSPFTPSHKPDHTDRPTVHGNGVDEVEDDDEDHLQGRTNLGGETVSGGTNMGGGIPTQTSRPYSPHDSNELGENDGDHHDDSEGNDEDLKSSGSARPEKMSLRRALFMYLMPLYMAWFGGIIVDLL